MNDRANRLESSTCIGTAEVWVVAFQKRFQWRRLFFAHISETGAYAPVNAGSGPSVEYDGGQDTTFELFICSTRQHDEVFSTRYAFWNSDGCLHMAT